MKLFFKSERAWKDHMKNLSKTLNHLQRLENETKKAVYFLISFTKEDILSLKNEVSNRLNTEKLGDFNELPDELKKGVVFILDDLHFNLNKFNNQRSMDEFFDYISKKTVKSEELGWLNRIDKIYINHLTYTDDSFTLSFYLACRMLKLYPKTKKYKEFKRKVEEYLGIEPY